LHFGKTEIFLPKGLDTRKSPGPADLPDGLVATLFDTVRWPR
jgi:hypothetical protein